MEKSRFLDKLWHEKSVSIIVLLKKIMFNKGKNCCSLLARESHCTYSHTLKILDAINKANLVKFEKEGREKRVLLTDKGYVIVDSLEIIAKTLE